MASSSEFGSPATPGQVRGAEGPTRRRRRSRAAARAEIVAAAEAALRDMPFSDLTVDILMQRTGMTRSSFYHYFIIDNVNRG